MRVSIGRAAGVAGFVAILLLLFGCERAPSGSVAGLAQGSGYSLKFAKDFRNGMNGVDDLGISIVLAMDVSGSMQDAPAQGGAPKFQQAAKALETITDYLDRFATKQKDLVVRVAILRFNEEVEVILPMTTLDRTGIADLRALVSNPDNFPPGGKTAIGSALETGTELLAQSGTILRSLIVVTDGESNEGPEPAKVMDAIYANRNSASRPDSPVTTSTELVSFIGFDTDSGYFGDFQTKGARVTKAGDQADLEKSLQDLLEADITKLEAPTLK